MHIIHEEIGVPKVVANRIDGNTVLFAMEPLPSGYGTTIGNSLRRVLLSSLPGSAPVAIKIKGAKHEFAVVPGFTDSVLDIMLNLKNLYIKKHTKDSSTLKIHVKNREGVITAADIVAHADVEILNPDLYITTLDNKSVECDIEILIEKGVGYLPASELKKRMTDTDWLIMDAAFSPIRRVKYDVVSARFGQRTDLDRLDLTIETNGVVSPEEALKFSSTVLKSYFGLFELDGVLIDQEFLSNAEDILKSETENKQREIEKEKESYTPVEILNLSPRTLNALINGGIGSIEQLSKCTESKLANLRGFGKKAMTEIRAALEKKGLKLLGDD